MMMTLFFLFACTAGTQDSDTEQDSAQDSVVDTGCDGVEASVWEDQWPALTCEYDMICTPENWNNDEQVCLNGFAHIAQTYEFDPCLTQLCLDDLQAIMGDCDAEYPQSCLDVRIVD